MQGNGHGVGLVAMGDPEAEPACVTTDSGLCRGTWNAESGGSVVQFKGPCVDFRHDLEFTLHPIWYSP